MYFALSCLITAVIALVLGLFVYLKNRKQFTNKIWCLLSISIFVWEFAYFMLLVSIDKGKALLWTRVLYCGATLIPVFFLDFVHSFFRPKRSTEEIDQMDLCNRLGSFKFQFDTIFH
ncbi:hypothetical protein ES705_31290 [subsurface metagenome]